MMSKREKKVKAVYSSIERGLTLLGAIAVEDKLQGGARFNCKSVGFKKRFEIPFCSCDMSELHIFIPFLV